MKVVANRVWDPMKIYEMWTNIYIFSRETDMR